MNVASCIKHKCSSRVEKLYIRISPFIIDSLKSGQYGGMAVE